MGNRAIIQTRESFENEGIGVYLHWNGGRSSVEGFLKYCKLKGYRAPEEDSYGWARLCQVIGNFFGGTLSLGIDNFSKDAGGWQDNGTYIIENWEIVGRECWKDEWGEDNSYDLHDMLVAIDEAQPKSEQLGDFINAVEVPVSKVKLGDSVYVQNIEDKYISLPVIGFGEDKVVNGTNVKGIPYVDRFVLGRPEDNINNYLCGDTVFTSR